MTTQEAERIIEDHRAFFATGQDGPYLYLGFGEIPSSALPHPLDDVYEAANLVGRNWTGQKREALETLLAACCDDKDIPKTSVELSTILKLIKSGKLRIANTD